MKEMPDNSVDSIVTDPPYELGFMGKSWDASGIAFNIEVWQEAIRVLKPGGHLIAFSGSRTYHRMAVAIEDAGFQIRDQIMWVYGSGFPKSHNVANGIDKKMGQANRGHAISSGSQIHPTTGEKRANGELLAKYESRTKESEGWAGWGTALKPAHEPMVLARKPIEGTVANNVLTHGVGGLNIDATRVGTETIISRGGRSDSVTGDERKGAALGMYGAHEPLNTEHIGRFPANFIHDGSDEVLALFPESKGMRTQRSGKNVKVYTGNSLLHSKTEFPEIRLGHNDDGSAARFFYCAKASKKDRNEGATNNHPTVKPTDLMRYLCRLVTPPAGIVLDPFMGSGSTGKAAILEGFDFIGIEQSAEYVEIAKARIGSAANAK